jgi:hypothetical protein
MKEELTQGQKNYRAQKARNKPKYESAHGVWIRDDLWIRLQRMKSETNKSLKEMLNEALFDYLLREELENKTGLSTKYVDTLYDPERGTLRKDEADSYIKED